MIKKKVLKRKKRRVMNLQKKTRLRKRKAKIKSLFKIKNLLLQKMKTSKKMINSLVKMKNPKRKFL
jgi:hypothetical protein